MKRLQNRIAESHYALVFVALYALAVWYFGGLVEHQYYVQLFCFVISSYLMVELNNSNALLRIRSRMVSCSFIVLMAMSSFLFPSLRSALVTLCFVTFYIIIFHTYQDHQSPGYTFYAFLALGIASVMLPQVVFFVPFIWLMMAFWLMAFSWRMWIASLLGLLAPYWFIVPWYIYSGLEDRLIAHVVSLITFTPQTLPWGEQGWGSLLHSPQGASGWVSLLMLITFLFVFIIGLVGTVHFLRNASKDKIRTRMLYYIFISMFLLTVLFIIFQPQHFEALFGFMIVNASALIAHFIALTRTRFTNIAFFILIALVFLLTVCNLWMPSLLS